MVGAMVINTKLNNHYEPSSTIGDDDYNEYKPQLTAID